MAYIFGSQVGRPVVIADPGAMPATFSCSMGYWPGWLATNCVISGITGRTSGNYQFLLTLRNFTYVYVFGEKMGDFTVTGISCPGSCWGGNIDGMTYALAYYNSRAISITGTPVAMTMAGFGTYAFLVGGEFAYTDAENRMGHFTYNFRTVADPTA